MAWMAQCAPHKLTDYVSQSDFGNVVFGLLLIDYLGNR